MDADDPRHGTEAGNEQHLRDAEHPCPECADAKLRANRRRTKRRTMGQPATVELGALHDIVATWRAGGASLEDLSRHVGLHDSQILAILGGGPTARVYARTAAAIAVAARRGTPVTSAGVTRRVQALIWMGYSVRTIATHASLTVDTVMDARDSTTLYLHHRTRDAIVATYDRLHMTHPRGTNPQSWAGITRSRNTAARNGWQPPLAWLDIDLGTLATKASDHDIDPVVVERILAGDWRLRATRAEKGVVLDRWQAAGRSDGDLERLTGWNVRRDARPHLPRATESAA